jgi:hypothetical protein
MLPFCLVPYISIHKRNTTLAIDRKDQPIFSLSLSLVSLLSMVEKQDGCQ